MSVKLTDTGIQFPDNSTQTGAGVGNDRPFFKSTYHSYGDYQSFSESTFQRLILGTVDGDSHSGFDLANKKYVFKVAGYYLISATVGLYAGKTNVSDYFGGTSLSITISRNSSPYIASIAITDSRLIATNTGNGGAGGVLTHHTITKSGLIYANINDSIYLEAYCQSGQGSFASGGTPSYSDTSLSGYLFRY